VSVLCISYDASLTWYPFARQDAIDKVCGWKDAGIDLRVHSGIGYRGIGLLYAADGSYQMTDSPPDGNDICSPWAGGCQVQTGGFELYLAVQYDKSPPDPKACKANQDFDFPSGDECQYIFQTIMNGCKSSRLPVMWARLTNVHSRQY
jgi:hypothetical protein